ncbi:hypothetical protein GCM10020220_029900 [Nonomuraea rubra]
MIRWEPYRSSTGKPPRIRDISCCDAFQFACQAGQYLILRRNGVGELEEAARGRYPRARALWDHLLLEHAATCQEGNALKDIWRCRS